jgi:heat shock protein HspQ
MSLDTEFGLGERVQDQISGFEGIVTTIGYHIAGCNRFGVWPAGNGDSVVRRGEQEFFYADQLESVEGEGFTDRSDESNVDCEFVLGQRVQDRVTGVEGVISIINYKLWNCPQIFIQPTTTSESGEKSEGSWFDDTTLQAVDGYEFTDDFDEEQNSESESETGSLMDSRPRNDSR